MRSVVNVPFFTHLKSSYHSVRQSFGFGIGASPFCLMPCGFISGRGVTGSVQDVVNGRGGGNQDVSGDCAHNSFSQKPRSVHF